MHRCDKNVSPAAAWLYAVCFVSACTTKGSGTPDGTTCEPPPDCGDQCAAVCATVAGGGIGSSGHPSAVNRGDAPANTHTDEGCGGPNAPRCGEGKKCNVDSDCEVVCNYAHRCVSAPSCKNHLGGDTCGELEDEPGINGESCCRSLLVAEYVDKAHPGKQVYLDKFEITAGRVRAWIDQLAAASEGKPGVKAWIEAHRPDNWDKSWEKFLPSDWEGGKLTIARRLLGDPRPEDSGQTGPPGPGVILPPSSDQVRNLGINYQFGSEVYVDLHGNNCGTFANAFGFPTYYYPPDILARDSELPRADGKMHTGERVSAQDLLDVKSMNCITHVMLAAFCAWDGGQLATEELLDYVTATPPSLGNTSGCGTQYDDHGELLGNIFTSTVQSGGRCAAVKLINATFDSGDQLPVVGSPLNQHNYSYPDTGNPAHDKSWQISAPGRASSAVGAGGAVDAIRLRPGDEPWMDLHGNLNESAMATSGGRTTGKFALKYRGIGYGSSRSDLNVTPMTGESVLRIQRPEAKAAYMGGRCMRFK